MKLALAFLLLGAAPLRASVTAEETALSERLSSQADDFLSSILGPGRGKVVVAVEGEQTQSSFQSESASPSSRASAESRLLMLPGYGKGKEDKVVREPLAGGETSAPNARRSVQSSTLESGLQIMRMRVSVVLDSRLPQDQVASVNNLLPEFLHLDTTRGDEFTVLRADLKRETWWGAARGYFTSKDGVGTVTVLAGAALLILLSSFLLRRTADGAIRTLASELKPRRAAGLAGEQEPELLEGGMPRLEDAPAELVRASAAPIAPQLGQRFDFLASRSPAELARILVVEPAEELAQLFATLTASHPDLAASLFASLSAETRAAVSLSLAEMTAADPERLEALENRLKDGINFGLSGPERLGQILSRLPASDREPLLRDVVTMNPEAAADVQRTLFAFEDIFGLEDAPFRRAIGAAPYADWGTALRGAPQEAVARVMAEMDRAAQSALAEIMDAPQPRAKVLEARSRILTRVLALAERGEISLRPETTEMI